MAFDFSAVFSATGSLFGTAGTYGDSAGTAFGITILLDDLSGQVETTEGVFVPAADCLIRASKAAMGTTVPTRGGCWAQGTYYYDIIDPPQEDASRYEWRMQCRRRQ